MLQWILDKIDEWKFEKEFKKKKKRLLEADPFIYDIGDDDKKN